MPTDTPSTATSSTLSAAPTCSTIRLPRQWSGTSTSRTCTPVGLAAGGCGARSGKGITTFV